MNQQSTANARTRWIMLVLLSYQHQWICCARNWSSMLAFERKTNQEEAGIKKAGWEFHFIEEFVGGQGKESSRSWKWGSTAAGYYSNVTTSCRANCQEQSLYSGTSLAIINLHVNIQATTSPKQVSGKKCLHVHPNS